MTITDQAVAKEFVEEYDQLKMKWVEIELAVQLWSSLDPYDEYRVLLWLDRSLEYWLLMRGYDE